MPRGIKAEAAPVESSAPGNGKPSNKYEGVRLALSTIGNEAKPLEIQSWLKTTHKMKMPVSTISNYKSSILSGGYKKAKTRGRKPKAKGGNADIGGITVEDIKAVQELVNRIGADKVRDLAGVLAK